MPIWISLWEYKALKILFYRHILEIINFGRENSKKKKTLEYTIKNKEYILMNNMIG